MVFNTCIFYVACPIGYYGKNCSHPCPSGAYGPGCRQICNCSNCHPVHGCYDRNGKNKVGVFKKMYIHVVGSNDFKIFHFYARDRNTCVSKIDVNANT